VSRRVETQRQRPPARPPFMWGTWLGLALPFPFPFPINSTSPALLRPDLRLRLLLRLLLRLRPSLLSSPSRSLPPSSSRLRRLRLASSQRPPASPRRALPRSRRSARADRRRGAPGGWFAVTPRAGLRLRRPALLAPAPLLPRVAPCRRRAHAGGGAGTRRGRRALSPRGLT